MQGSNEVDVSKEDQVYINEFSRIFSKNKIIDSQIKKNNEILESWKDADSAIEESFGEGLKLSIGECFVETDDEQAKEYVEKMRKKYNLEMKSWGSKYDVNKKRWDELKIIWYSKFGNRLKLDEE